MEPATIEAIIRHVYDMVTYAEENAPGIAAMEITDVLAPLLRLNRRLSQRQGLWLLAVLLRNPATRRIVQAVRTHSINLNNTARTLAEYFVAEFQNAVEQMVNAMGTAIEVQAGVRRGRDDDDDDDNDTPLPESFDIDEEEEPQLFVLPEDSRSRAPSEAPDDPMDAVQQLLDTYGHLRQPPAGGGAVYHPRLANSDDLADDNETDDDASDLPREQDAQNPLMIVGYWNDLDNNDPRNDPSVPITRAAHRAPYFAYELVQYRHTPAEREQHRLRESEAYNRLLERSARDRAHANQQFVQLAGRPEGMFDAIDAGAGPPPLNFDINPRPEEHYTLIVDRLRPELAAFLRDHEGRRTPPLDFLRDVLELPHANLQATRRMFEEWAMNLLMENNRVPLGNGHDDRFNRIAAAGDYRGLATMLAQGVASLLGKYNALVRYIEEETPESNTWT